MYVIIKIKPEEITTATTTTTIIIHIRWVYWLIRNARQEFNNLYSHGEGGTRLPLRYVIRFRIKNEKKKIWLWLLLTSNQVMYRLGVRICVYAYNFPCVITINYIKFGVGLSYLIIYVIFWIMFDTEMNYYII